jgi:DNA-binding XRE family transcriptional regulator
MQNFFVCFSTGRADKMTVGVTGNQMKAARAAIAFNHADIAAAAGLTRQTVERLERSGSQPAISRDAIVAAVLATLGARGVMLVPHGLVLAS